MLELRPEAPDDVDAVRKLHLRAFDPSRQEADLVDELRRRGDSVPELCLVADEEGAVIGQITFSRARVESGHEVLALAPIGVLPEHQNRGVGSALVQEGLRRAAMTSFPLVVVLGHPAYYPRFGFEPGREAGLLCPYDGVPGEAWMIRRLPSYSPGVRGKVAYARAFDDLA